MKSIRYYLALIQRKFNDRVIVFVKTKNDCHRLCLLLNLLDIKASELHGGLTQNQVENLQQKFTNSKVNIQFLN